MMMPERQIKTWFLVYFIFSAAIKANKLKSYNHAEVFCYLFTKVFEKGNISQKQADPGINKYVHTLQMF